MYVCVCAAVSDKTVRRAIGGGACSVRDLKQRLGVAANCGRCIPELRTLLASLEPSPRTESVHGSICNGHPPALASGV
jgi:bacterioferritin-associated ferredoxin